MSEYALELPASVTGQIDDARGPGESREEFVGRALELAKTLETALGHAEIAERRSEARPAGASIPVVVPISGETSAWLEERAQQSGCPTSDFVTQLLLRVLQWRSENRAPASPPTLASLARSVKKSVLDDPSVRWAFRVGSLDDSPLCEVWDSVMHERHPPRSPLTKFVEIVVFPREWKKPRR